MTDGQHERKLKALDERLGSLWKQWHAANAQLNATVNAADREPLKLQIRQLDREIGEAEDERGHLQTKSPDPNRRYLEFEGKIHKIDFGEVKALLASFVAQAEPDGAAALFLIQNSKALGGKWCLEVISNKLKESLDYKPHPIAFTRNDRLDEIAILDKLAHRFGVAPVAGNPDEYVSTVVKSICGSIHTGNTVFIEIRNWDYFCNDDRVFGWFVEQFWARLVQAFRVHHKRRNAKLVVTLVTNRPVLARLLERHGEDKANPTAERLRLLPLRNWRRDEVEDFLDSGVFQWENGMTVAQMTDLIYEASEGGRPDSIYESLREHIFNEA